VFGGVDILVNCAAGDGGGEREAYSDVTAAALHGAIDAKTMGYLACIQAVAPHMTGRGWGRIISLSGLGSRRSGSVVGTIRNVAVVAMSKNLADELAGSGINVTVVHPGATRTERTTAETRGIPNLIGRMPEAAEVAYVVAFLCSPRSIAISGDAIGAGGGMPGVLTY
jgi:NAD(P)-dependent dehydrogenase (short-subunit alcohol dehydrogenase family)